MAERGRDKDMNKMNEKWSFQVRPSMSLFSVSQPKFHPNFHIQTRSEEQILRKFLHGLHLSFEFANSSSNIDMCDVYNQTGVQSQQNK